MWNPNQFFRNITPSKPVPESTQAYSGTQVAHSALISILATLVSQWGSFIGSALYTLLFHPKPPTLQDELVYLLRTVVKSQTNADTSETDHTMTKGMEKLKELETELQALSGRKQRDKEKEMEYLGLLTYLVKHCDVEIGRLKKGITDFEASKIALIRKQKGV